MKIIILVIIFALASIATAQDDCGDGLPCGPIPWTIPLLPPLVSPTPMSVILDSNPNIPPTFTPTPTFTLTPTITPTPTIGLPTATAFFDGDSIIDQVATLNSISAGEFLVDDGSGDLIGMDDLFEMDTSESATLFGYIKGLNTTIFGPFTPMVGIIVFSFVSGWILGGIKFIIPLVAAAIGLVRSIIKFIMDVIKFLLGFIPFFG